MFAQSGSPLSQYIAYARHACTVYRPQRMAFVIVGNDFEESLYAHRARDGIHHLHPRADGFDLTLTPPVLPRLTERLARNSALALYLVRNVGIIWKLRDWGAAHAAPAPNAYVGNTAADASPERLAQGERVIAWFFGELARSCVAPADILLLVDPPRPQLYDPAALKDARASYFGRMRVLLIEKARAAGFAVADLETHFGDSYAKDGRVFEVPGDGHWNAHAHGVAAEAVRAAFRDGMSRP